MAESRLPKSQHTLRFAGTLVGLKKAADALRSLLDARQLDEGPRYNVELAFDEIAANIIRHGSPKGEVSTVVAFDDDEIVMTFEDDGVPFDPCGRPDPVPPTSIDETPVGGLGLMLVRKISTRMAYKRTPDERNHLTLAIPAR